MAVRTIPKPAKKSAKQLQVNLYEAKTQLSSLVERAANGEEIVIAKAGKPMARLVNMEGKQKPGRKRLPGRNLLGITYMAPDWDAPLSEEELKEWGM
jgi:prevent-host-death family protein